MESAIYNFTIEQNSNFDRIITLKNSNGNPMDLTNATALLIARENEGDATPVINLTQGSGLTLGGSAGTIAISISDTTNAEYDFNVANYTLKVNGKIKLRGEVDLVKDKSA